MRPIDPYRRERLIEELDFRKWQASRPHAESEPGRRVAEIRHILTSADLAATEF